MNNTDMPPIRTDGPQACATVQLYLAVLNDLPAEQVQGVLQHVDMCAGCAAELRLLTQATQLVTNLAELRHSGNRRSEQGMSARTCAFHTLSSHIAHSSHALAHGASSRSTHVAGVLECPPLPEWPPHHISDIRVTCESLLEWVCALL